MRFPRSAHFLNATAKFDHLLRPGASGEVCSAYLGTHPPPFSGRLACDQISLRGIKEELGEKSGLVRAFEKKIQKGTPVPKPPAAIFEKLRCCIPEVFRDFRNGGTGFIPDFRYGRFWVTESIMAIWDDI